MAEEKEKRKMGRPALPGKRVIVKLDTRHLERARALGNGKISAGVRKALEG